MKPSRQRLPRLHDLQHDRNILLACCNDLLALYRDLEHKPHALEIYRNIVMESTRVSLRLIAVQKKIEDLDLD